MYLARFQLDEVSDTEEHEGQQVSDRGSERKQQQQSPNNTTFVDWSQSSR
jgi:hypothetical protein